MPLGSWGVLNYIQDVHCELSFWCFKRSCQDDVNLVFWPYVWSNVSAHAQSMLRLHVIFLVNLWILCFIANHLQLFACTCRSHINVFLFFPKNKKKEIYRICILGFGKSELRVMTQKLPYNSLVLMTLLWGVCVLLFENEHRDFHTRLCTTKQNTNLVFYIMCPWVRLTQTRQALNVLSISFFLWLDFFFPCSKPLKNNNVTFTTYSFVFIRW